MREREREKGRDTGKGRCKTNELWRRKDRRIDVFVESTGAPHTHKHTQTDMYTHSNVGAFFNLS